MTLPPKSSQLQKHREEVLSAVQRLTKPPYTGAVMCRHVVEATGLDDRLVDRTLQFWKKEGKLVFLTKAQARKGKSAGWSVK